MTPLGKALRTRFKTPQQAMQALGLDPTLLATDSKETVAMTLSRKALMVHGAIAAYLVPKLAQDAKADILPAFKDVTHKNFRERRPQIVSAIEAATKGKLAKDAKLSDLPNVLMAFDAMEPEEPKAKDAEDLPEPGGGKGKGPAKDAEGGIKEFLKSKLSEDDYKAACDMMEDPDGAEDEEDDEKDKEKPNAKDEEKEDKVDKKAMDAAIKEATTTERQRARDVRDAERFVRPYVGDLAVAYDSAEEVLRAALEIKGEKAAELKGIPASGLRMILGKHLKAGEVKRSEAVIAQDASGGESFTKMFPEAAKVKVA